MNERIRNPSAVALSAQNLAFASQPFLGASSQASNVPQQILGIRQQIANNVGIPSASPADLTRQAQKLREYEQQRMKLQQWNVKTTSATNPDAMIAQIVGRPLAANPSGGAMRHRQPTITGPISYGGPTGAVSTAPSYAPGFGPAVSFSEARHQPNTTRPSVPGRDLEKVVHHVAGMQIGNDKVTPGYPGERFYSDMASQNYQTLVPMGGVFVIPTLSSAMSPDGQYHPTSGAGLQFMMPPWTRDKAKLPEEYLKYFQACLSPGRPQGLDMPDTGLVYVLLRTSGLSNEILGTIWALTNRSHPGQLTKEEFFTALALVALAQENGSIASWDVLSNISKPPIPRLSSSALNVNGGSTVPPPIMSMTPSISSAAGKQSTAGNMGPVTTSAFAALSVPASQSFPVPTSPDANDDFDEFTDFQTAAAPAVPAVVSDRDMYGALRALAGPAQDCSSNEMGRSLSTVAGHNGMNLQTQSTGKSVTDTDIPTNHSSASGTGVARSQTDSKIALSAEMGNVQKKDLNELLRQAWQSLDLGHGAPASGLKSDEDTGSFRSGSKEPSIHSLDLQSIKTYDLEEESGETPNRQVQSGGNRPTWSPTASISLVDRYAAFREHANQNGEISTADKHVAAWTKCLEACLQLLKQAEKVFSKADDESVRKEILTTDRGSKYLCGNLQIYRVFKRIRLSLQTTAFQTDKLIELLTDIETTWANLSRLVAFSGILPTSDKLDFRNAVIQPIKQMTEEEKKACCGVCLLNVNASCETGRGSSFDYKLTYGGRQYHAQCANLWINCIDPVLPALDIPCLL